MPKSLVVFGNLNVLYGAFVVFLGIVMLDYLSVMDDIRDETSHGFAENVYWAAHLIAGSLLMLGGFLLSNGKPSGFYLSVIACLAQLLNKAVGFWLIMGAIVGDTDGLLPTSLTYLFFSTTVAVIFSPGGVFLLVQLLVLLFSPPTSWKTPTVVQDGEMPKADLD